MTESDAEVEQPIVPKWTGVEAESLDHKEQDRQATEAKAPGGLSFSRGQT